MRGLVLSAVLAAAAVHGIQGFINPFGVPFSCARGNHHHRSIGQILLSTPSSSGGSPEGRNPFLYREREQGMPLSMPLSRRQAPPSKSRQNDISRQGALKNGLRLGLLALGGLSARGAQAAIPEPTQMDQAMDFLQQLKIELLGAREEFEELPSNEAKKLLDEINPKGAEKAYFAVGCYWGGEATFRCTRDVVATRVGFMGGVQPAPYYENCKDHLEVIEVTYVGGDATYERLLKVCGRTYDFVDVGARYARKIWTSSSGQKTLATRKKESWSSMPVADASTTFFTPAKLDHQAYSKPRCDNAAPNAALIFSGIRRSKDHYHYASDCPTCTLKGSAADELDEKRI